MITLRWAPFPGALISGFKIYRSMIGFPINLPNELTPDLSALTLELRVNDGMSQTVTFTGDLILEDLNNQLSGVKTYVTQTESGEYVLVRNNMREAPGKLQILGGTALTALGLAPKIITEGSESQLIATVTELSPEDGYYEFFDVDGSLSDLYSISTLDAQGNESERTPPQRASSFVGKVCVIEGLVHDIQGVRIPDVIVRVTPLPYAQSGRVAAYYTADAVESLSDSSGRFSIPLMQGAHVQIDIEALNFSKKIQVPNKAYEFITMLPSDYDFRFASEGMSR